MPIKLDGEPWPDDRAILQNIREQEGGATRQCARCKGLMTPWDKRWATNGAHPDAWKCVLGLEARVKELEGIPAMTYCAYCNEEFLIDDEAAEQVTQHIWACSQHPMRGLQEKIHELEADIKQCRDNYDGNHA